MLGKIKLKAFIMTYQNFYTLPKVQIALYLFMFASGWGNEAIAKNWRKVEPTINGTLKTGFVYTDNVFRKDKNRESDYIYTAAPELWWKGEFGNHFFATRYKGEYSKFFSHEEQDYDDHEMSLDLGFNFTNKFHVDIGSQYVISHDEPQAPGTTTESFRSPTRWNERKIYGTFTYGRQYLGAAEIRLALYGKKLRYKNNNQGIRDRDGFGVKLSYVHPIKTKINLLTQFRYNKSDFKKQELGTINQNNEGYSFWLGGSWEHTEKIESRLLLGYVRQISDSSFLSNFSGIGVEGSLFWKPKQNDLITLKVFRTPEESSDSGDGFFISNQADINWRHDFENIIHVNLGVNYRYDDFNSQNRIEKYIQANMGLSYSWTKFIELGSEYSFTYRDSSIKNSDYHLNMVSLFIKILPPF